MDFQIQKLKNLGKKYTITIPILASLIIILILGYGIVKALNSIDLGVLLKVAGEELQQDNYGHTNFLLLGTGGKFHEGGNLTDSIIVASLDNENKLLTMLSIPRDLYVENTEIVDSRINEIYFNAKTKLGSSAQGLEYMKKKVEEIVGIPIHYWIKINFQGFKDLVDALGGIDIEVKEAIYDPFYPKDGTFLYEPFSISPGLHHMDGEVALKYARSRKTTSDFDRAERQQQILYAIKDQALKTDTIFSKDKIKNILTALKENIETNIKVQEILTLGSFAKDFSPNQLVHRLIHDDPTKCGGFVYTPMREAYNGMFVLIPAGGFKFLHLYADLNFNTPKIIPASDKIHILNGTGSAGTAGEAKQIFQRFCFDITRFSNARSKELKETTYYYQIRLDENGEATETPEPLSIQFLQKLIPGKVSTEIPQEYITEGYFNSANVLLEIGEDYINSPDYLNDPFYYLPAAPATPSKPVAPEVATEATDASDTPATDATSSTTPLFDAATTE
ncbi:LCP family protein [Candidatus Peregrinibacteria bacterium]|nr:LCP family protein [Candidatus Peregrinibacteria bacterium]